ncbi:MAG: T9SS type A sorting domain-containing protein [Bacteroidetes bacterium]|nr:T9SS type A sorting domain-containing protein [Bacteroidota bacterium]
MIRFFSILIFSISICTSGMLYSQVNTYPATLGTTSTMPANYFGYNGANFVRPTSPFYNDIAIIDSASQLGTSNLRYPAGVPGNFWDWQAGSLVRESAVGLQLPPDFDNAKYRDNRLEKLKKFVDRGDVVPSQNLNVLCSDPLNETARLWWTRGLNIPAIYFEFGSELYDDNYPQYTSKWPEAEDYINDMNQWAMTMKSMAGGNTIKIAVVGATNRRGLEPLLSRRNRWSSVMLNQMNSSIDAITYHHYIASGVGEGTPVTLTNLKRTLSSAYSSMENFKSIELDITRVANKEAWVTEYNLFDRSHCIQSTWAQGLMLAMQTLLYNEDSIIKFINCHSLIADGTWGSIFSDTIGLDLGIFYNDQACNSQIKTSQYERTAGGNAMALVGKAMFNATSRTPINFATSPSLYLNYKSLYGWRFESPTTSQAILVNMDSVDVNVVFSMGVWSLNGYKFEQVTHGPGGPLEYIKGNAVTNPGPNQLRYFPLANVANNTITLKAYSITRLVTTKNALQIKVMDNEICSGSSTGISVYGQGNFSWTPTANITFEKADKSVVNFTANVANTTTYTVTVTNGAGLSATATIRVYPKPKINATATLYNTCKNMPIKLGVTFTGGNTNAFKSLIWLPSKLVDNPTSEIVNVNPTTTTTYTVVGTDGRCWGNMDSVTVRVNNTADIVDSRVVCRDSMPFRLFTKQFRAKYTYNWYLGSQLIGTGKNVFVSPDTATTYMMVMYNNFDPSCRDTDFVTITPITCCGSKDSVLLTMGPFIKMSDVANRIKKYAQASGNGICTNNSLTNFFKEIVINGELSVDSSYTFTNCTKIKFGENARVIFNGEDAVLTFNNCKLSGADCDANMWQGFEFTDWYEALIISNCEISDAKTAVQVSHNPSITINNCVFRNNYISLEFIDLPESFWGNFYADSFAFTALKKPYVGQKPFAGIKIKNVLSVKLGKMSSSPNVFYNLPYGIYTENSNIHLENNDFVNILSSGGSDVNEGSAVFMNNPNGYGNPLDHRQIWPFNNIFAGHTNNATGGNTFANCTYGINAINSQFELYRNEFINTEHAICCIGCVGKEHVININNIDSCATGITLTEPKLSNITITNNSIDNSFDVSNYNNIYGVSITDDVLLPSTITFDDNVIYNYGKYGLYLANANRPFVRENKFYMQMGLTGGVDMYGIRMENCDSANVRCNLAKGLNVNLSTRTGMSFANCNAVDFRCNVADFLNDGFEFFGNCNNSISKNNEMKYLNIGLLVGKESQVGGVIGPQPKFGGTPGYRNYFKGRFINNSGAGQGKGNFGIAATRSINSFCAGGKNDLTRFYVLNGLDAITNDSSQIPFINDLLGTGTAFTPHYYSSSVATCDGGCTMMFSKVALSDEEHADEMPLAPYIVASQAKQVLENVNDDFLAYSLRCEVAEYSNERVTNNDWFSLIRKIMHEHNTGSDVLAKAIAINEQLLPTNLYELNEKMVNAFQLNQLQTKGRGFTSIEIQALEDIALQCPFDGGMAVIRAQAMLSNLQPYRVFDNDKLCAQRIRNSTVSNMQMQEVMLFPNPASGELNISAMSGNHINRIEIFTPAMQRIKLIEDVNAQTFKLQTSEMPNGIYFVEVTCGSSSVTRKFVISH